MARGVTYRASSGKTEFTREQQAQLEELYKYADALKELRARIKTQFPSEKLPSDIPLQMEFTVKKIVELEVEKTKAQFTIVE